MTNLMAPKRMSTDGFDFHGKYYVGVEDSDNLYLHSDCVVRDSTKNKDNGEWTGYFNSKEDAQIAMANFWIEEYKEESKVKPLTDDELNLIFKDTEVSRLYYIIKGRLFYLGCDDIILNAKRQVFGFLCKDASRSEIQGIGWSEYESMRELLRKLGYEENANKYKDEQELIDVLKTI